MLNKDSKISFTNDIISEAARELNISESKVRSVYDTQIMYLKYLTDKTDAVAIYIPFIGTLHVKVGYLFKQIDKYSKKESDKDKLSIFQSKKNIIDSHLQEHIKNSYKGTSRHLEKNKINRYVYNAGKTMQEIQDIQNSR